MSRPFLVRAGSVIDCLAGERGPATLDDIQRRTGIQRNSLIKLLAVLHRTSTVQTLFLGDRA